MGERRSQIDSGAIDTVGPRYVAKAFEMKETEMSRRGIRHIAANGSSVEKNGEKKIADNTDDGESVSTRVLCADVKTVLCSADKTSMGANVVALDGGRSYMQSTENGQKRKIQPGEGAVRHALAVAVKERH